MKITHAFECATALANSTTTSCICGAAPSRGAPFVPPPVLVYPSKCRCPGCGTAKRVLFDGNEHVIESHMAAASQISDDLKDSFLIEYPCPASGAKVSAYKKPRAA